MERLVDERHKLKSLLSAAQTAAEISRCKVEEVTGELARLKEISDDAAIRLDERRKWIDELTTERVSLRVQLDSLCARMIAERQDMAGQLAAMASERDEALRKVEDLRSASINMLLVGERDLAERERDEAIQRAEQAERERDELKGRSQGEAICDAMDLAEHSERERIASLLDGLTEDSPFPRRDYGVQHERIAPVARMLAAAIRAGAHSKLLAASEGE